MKTLNSFNGSQSEKDFYVQRMKDHVAADELIHGQYWQNGKGCQWGCLLHSKDPHLVVEDKMGIPIVLSRLSDRIFEGLKNGEAKEYTLKFIESVPVGKDLTHVWKKFLVWLLVDPVEGVIKHAKRDQTKKAIQDVADLIERSLTEKITPEQFREVRRAAAAAAADAYAADAANAAANAAACAAAYAAANAAACAAAYAAARNQKYSKMAEKIIELLRN